MSSDMPRWTHARSRRVRSILAAVLLVLWAAVATAAGGPLGIDHRLSYDNSGIWKRSNQKLLLGLMVGAEVAGGL